MTSLPLFTCNLPQPDYAATVADAAAWASMLPILDGMCFTIDHWFGMDPTDQDVVAAFLAQHGIMLEVTIPGIKDWAPTAAEALTATIGKLRRLWKVRPFSVINIDEALRSAMNAPVNQTMAWTVDQVVTGLIAPLRTEFPGVLFSITEPMPHFSASTLQAYVQALIAAGFQPDQVVIDPNWGRKDMSWPDVATFGAWCDSIGLAWSIDEWDATTKADWESGLMSQGAACATTGINPTVYRVTSWIGKPATNAEFLSSASNFYARFISKG